MSTPNSRPPSRSSGAISSGADLIVALFEEERKKREAANIEQLKDIELRFKCFRDCAAMEYARVALKVQQVEAELERTKEDLSRARLDNIEARAVSKKAEAETARAKSQLDALKFSLEAFGMTYTDDLVVKFDDKPAQTISQLRDEIGANLEKTSPGADLTTMCSTISSLTQYNRSETWPLEGLSTLLTDPTIAAHAKLLVPPTSNSPKVEVSSSAKIQLPSKSEDPAHVPNLTQEPASGNAGSTMKLKWLSLPFLEVLLFRPKQREEGQSNQGPLENLLLLCTRRVILLQKSFAAEPHYRHYGSRKQLVTRGPKPQRPTRNFYERSLSFPFNCCVFSCTSPPPS